MILTNSMESVSIRLLTEDPDMDTLTTAVVTQGTKGIVSVTDSAQSIIKYTPNDGASGLDSFTVSVNDGSPDGTVNLDLSIDITKRLIISPVGTVKISSSQSDTIDLSIPAYYLPSVLTTSFWDAPTIGHVGVDLAYKFTGYDWLNRPITWSIPLSPANASINATTGVLTWTPSSESNGNFILRMTVDGQNYDRSFTCEVNNAKCSFVSPTGSDANPGTLASPYLTLGAAAASLTADNNPKMIIVRAGEYAINNTSWYTQPIGSGYRNLADRSYTKTDMLHIRNYPAEAAKFSFTGTSSGFIFNVGVNVQGLELSGGNISEHAGIRTNKWCVLKNLFVHDYASPGSGNCTGIKLTGGSVVDRCTSFNNYDRADPTYHNNSNWLLYGTTGEGETFIIDSISAGFSAQGFKIKHAGSISNFHIHRCVSYDTYNPWAGAQNGCSVRHSFFYKNSTLGASTNGSYTFGFAVTDPTTGGEDNLSVGMLCDNNIIIADNIDSGGLRQATYVGTADTATPCYYSNNIVQVAMEEEGAAFTTRPTNPMPAVWRARFYDNEFITPTKNNAVILSNAGASDLDILNTYGSGNIHSTTRRDLTIEACGSTWLYDESAAQLLRDGVPV